MVTFNLSFNLNDECHSSQFNSKASDKMEVPNCLSGATSVKVSRMKSLQKRDQYFSNSAWALLRRLWGFQCPHIFPLPTKLHRNQDTSYSHNQVIKVNSIPFTLWCIISNSYSIYQYSAWALETDKPRNLFVLAI